MKLSVELTLTPLQNDFEEPIIHFIKQLRKSGFKVLENPMSTQIYGNYDELMHYLTAEIKIIFEKSENVLLYIKMVKTDRSSYERNY
ncbi:thiamine-binding protein [Ascidiimonas sp. W6]|uniref:thiamine-binding protein n=1 Tax=Ascidiimonas meishanensis TaxID=3128903 RepID=UPI0030EC118B